MECRFPMACSLVFIIIYIKLVVEIYVYTVFLQLNHVILYWTDRLYSKRGICSSNRSAILQ